MDKQIVVYTQPNCFYCKKLKEFLGQKGIQYSEKDVAQDQQAYEELAATGHMSTPLTKIDGEIVVGFDHKKLETLLGLVVSSII
jgi:glutaredoxin-like YruB-family protein